MDGGVVLEKVTSWVGHGYSNAWNCRERLWLALLFDVWKGGRFGMATYGTCWIDFILISPYRSWLNRYTSAQRGIRMARSRPSIGLTCIFDGAGESTGNGLRKLFWFGVGRRAMWCLGRQSRNGSSLCEYWPMKLLALCAYQGTKRRATVNIIRGRWEEYPREAESTLRHKRLWANNIMP